MKLNYNFILIALLALLSVSCSTKTDSKINPLEEQITIVKNQFVPDKRVALFDVISVKNNAETILKGESNLPEAIQTLKGKLKAENITFVDSIQILPNSSLEGKTRGVIKISVANLRSKPAHSSELATQATLGTPVLVYKKMDNWYLIQTPDKYLSWVDGGGIQLMTSEEFATWKLADKIIFLDTYGQSIKGEQQNIVSDLVAGAILELKEESKSFYKVKYPDGRTASVLKNQAKIYKEWLADLNPTQESLIETSKKLMGLPYLWGGTSSKGVDCSGFTKTIYFLNGMIIPRDASQQVHTGLLTDEDKKFENLQAGDLLFFGTPATKDKKERVVHVGMWIGNNEFIHSSGRVHISSVDKNAPNYDEHNFNRYLRSKRILNQKDKNIINLAKIDVLKK